MGQQRWHEWRNMDVTTCPSHGVVRPIVPIFYPELGEVPNGGVVNISHRHGYQPISVVEYITPTDSELMGSDLLLHGMKPDYSFTLTDDGYIYFQTVRHGLSIKHAFNGDQPVEPGGIGLLTYDLPTWVLIGGSIVPDDSDPPVPLITTTGDYSFGRLVTALNQWEAYTVPFPFILAEHTACLYSLATQEDAKRVLVGGGVTFRISRDVIV